MSNTMLSPAIEVPRPHYEAEALFSHENQTIEPRVEPRLSEGDQLRLPSYDELERGRNAIGATGRLEADLPRSLVTGFHHAPKTSEPEKLLLRPDGTSIRRPDSRATDTTISREEYLQALYRNHQDKERGIASRRRRGSTRTAGNPDSVSTMSALSDWRTASLTSEGRSALYARDLPQDSYSGSIFIPRGFSRSGSRRGRTASSDQSFKRTTGATVSHSMKRPLTAMSIVPANGQTIALNRRSIAPSFDEEEADIASCYDVDSSTITSFMTPTDISVDSISNSLDYDRRALVHKLQSREARSNLALLEPKFQHRAIVNTAASDIKGRRQVVNGRKPKIMVHPFAGKDVDHTIKIRDPMSGSRVRRKRPQPNVAEDGNSSVTPKFVEEPGIWGPGRISWIIHATHGKYTAEEDDPPLEPPSLALSGDYPPRASSVMSASSISSSQRKQRYGDKVRHEHMYRSTKAAYKATVSIGGSQGYKSPIALARQTEAMSRSRKAPSYHPWTFFDSRQGKIEDDGMSL